MFEGLNWIISRMKKDLSVLLADEMGLGKTAQTISVIGHMLYAEKVAGPILVVVPQSTMDNWLAEFTQWLPNCNVCLYHGNPQAREVVRREEMRFVRAQPMNRKAFDSFVHPRSKLTSMSKCVRAGVCGCVRVWVCGSVCLCVGYVSFAGNQSLRQLITNRVRHRCDVVVTTPSILQCADDLAFLRQIHWYYTHTHTPTHPHSHTHTSTHPHTHPHSLAGTSWLWMRRTS